MKKISIVINLMKLFGDSVCASAGIQLPQKLFGYTLTDGQLGVSGLTASLIGGYQLFPSAKK